MESGKKLHRYIRQLLPGVPLSGIYKMIRTGRVKRNGRRAKADDVIYAGDQIQLYMDVADFARVSKHTKKFSGVPSHIDVVYEDDNLLIVNKPAGLLVHGAPGEFRDTLVNRVLAYLHRKGSLEQQVFTPAPVNRLDRNTSGIVLFGKNSDTLRQLSGDLANRRIRKWYVGVVQRALSERGEMAMPVARVEEENRTLVLNNADGNGKSAVTRFVCIARAGGTSLVGIELVSGRTHQIRAHFASVGHPLCGDVRYGGRAASMGLAHYLLHAAWVQLADGRRWNAPLPDAFQRQLTRLGYKESDVIQAVHRLPDMFESA